MQPKRKKKKIMQGETKCVDLSPQLKYCICPQCVKAKINSSIKGRSYLKHLFIYLFIFEISFTPANVSSQKKNNNKTKNIKH